MLHSRQLHSVLGCSRQLLLTEAAPGSFKHAGAILTVFTCPLSAGHLLSGVKKPCSLVLFM
jgi:hypothetical protein